MSINYIYIVMFFLNYKNIINTDCIGNILK